MKLSNVSRVGDCGARVLYFMEDETGNVAAVGRSLCVIPMGSHIGHSNACEGQTLAYVEGAPLTIRQQGSDTIMELPQDKSIILPMAHCGVYDFCYIPSVHSVFLLADEGLIRVSLAGSAQLLWESEASVGPLEKLAGNDSYVAACRYSLVVHELRGGKQVYRSDERSYTSIAFISNSELAAADEYGGLTIIRLDTGVESSLEPLSGHVYFLGSLFGRLVAVHGQDRTMHCSVLLQGSWQQVNLGQVNCESFSLIG